ncbi:hypothetical protein RvY_10120 [Ramazzottius varieornatus]|uniref:Glutaminyl-peptide cyclotransferase n=1 Tax=Ramazzottius varieornatus TaxID=947166 RepID=A0A1D1VBR3_RAMVA|nr:hypothetical protein RvY_10120 [Ramazzottius varieornatus]
MCVGDSKTLLRRLLVLYASGLAGRTFGQFSHASSHWRQLRQNRQMNILSETSMTNAARLVTTNDFKTYLNPILVPRVSGTQGNADVRTYITNTLTTLGYAIEHDTFVGSPPAPFFPTSFTNIIATLNPLAPRRLVLACHYDSKFFKDAVFVGATDSAVPCAMILHLAASLNDALKGPRRTQDVTLQLIFFDGEEAFADWTPTDSIYGSKHLAEKMEASNQLSGIDLMVLLDLIGGPRITFRNFFPETSNSYERMSVAENVLRSGNMLKSAGRQGNMFQPGLVESWFRVEDDHLPFQQRGVPILHLIPLPFPAVWHTPADDASHLDFDSIDDLNAILRVFVCEYLDLSL